MSATPNSSYKYPTRFMARHEAQDWAWRSMEARTTRRGFARARSLVEKKIASQAETEIMSSVANCYWRDGAWVRRTSWHEEVVVVSTSTYKVQIEKETRERLKEYREYLAAKRQARSMGLKYWPALLWNIRTQPEKRVDPRAFLIAEEVLYKEAGSFWGDPPSTQTWGKSHGGWDAQDHYGPSAAAVARMWWAAGCRDSEKFRVQVRMNTVVGRGMTLPETIHFCRGRRWVEGNHLNQNFRLSRKAVTALGRLSPVLRWAAVSGLPYSRNVRIRDLNWAEVARMQSLPRYKQAEASYLPIKLSWQLQGHEVPKLCLDYLSRLPRRLAVPSSLIPALGKECFAALATAPSENVVPALAVAALFRREAKRWVDTNGGQEDHWNIYGVTPLWAWHDPGQKPMLIEAEALVLEENRAAWARLCWITKGAALDYAASWHNILEYLGKVPHTLSELREAATKAAYGAAANPAEELLQVRAVEAKLSKGQYLEYRDLINSPQASYERVPYVRVTGEDVSLEGEWVLERIASDDPIGPMLGLLTNCCQHLEGAASSCANRIWDHPRASAWVVRYKGSVVAQSYMWVYRKALVIDSVEALGSAYVEGIARLYKEAANEVLGKLGILEVWMGDTRYGITLSIKRLISDGTSREMSGCPSSYSDAHHACLVASCGEPLKQQRFPKIKILAI